MINAGSNLRRPDPYWLATNRFMPRSLRLVLAADRANALIRKTKKLFNKRHEAPCAECRLWEHYDVKVTLGHLVRPVGSEGERWQDDITPLLDPSEAYRQYSIMYRKVFFRDRYEDAPVELPCEIDDADRHDTADWMIRLVSLLRRRSDTKRAAIAADWTGACC